MRGDFLVIPDLHIPYEHPDALAFVLAVDRTWFPGGHRVVVCLGDEVDSHSISRHMPDPNGRSPGDELADARKTLQEWFSAFPKVNVCVSNHTIRPWKRAYESGLPKEFMKEVGEVFGAPPTWKWADRWTIDGVTFEHGEGVSGALAALNAAKQNRMSTCIGHLHHSGGVIHSASPETGIIWGLNCGCLIDQGALAFAYARTLRNRPTLGCGVIKNGVPCFVPMQCTPDGRWALSV